MSDTQTDLTTLSADDKRSLLARLLQDDSDASATPISNLSMEQRRLWFLRKLDASVPWHVSTALRCPGDLHLAALQQAFAGLLMRHASLRSVFVETNGQPFRITTPAGSLPIPIVEAGRQDLAEVSVRRFREPFDVTSGPLIRATVVRCAPDDHVVLVTAHRLVADRPSLRLLAAELAAAYRRLAAGAPVEEPLPEPDFADLMRAEQEWLDGPEAADDLDYWRVALAGLEPLDALTHRTRPESKTFGAVTHGRPGEATLATAIAEFAAARGVDRPTVVLAALSALIGRLGRRDFAIGVPVPGRAAPGLVGPLENVVPVRCDFSGERSFAEWTTMVDGWLREAVQHGRVPFERIVAEAAPRRDIRYSPLFQVQFRASDEAAAPSEAETLSLPTGFAAVDLEVDVSWRRGGLGLELTGNSDLFGEPDLRLVTDRLIRLIGGALADPDKPVALLDIMDERERGLVLREWNQTSRGYPEQACLHDLITAQAAATPGQLAVICGEDRLTYAGLHARATALAAALRAAGARPDVPVAVAADRSAHALVAVLAVLYAGGAYLPLDPGYPPERLRYTLADSGAVAITGTPQATAALHQAAPGLPVIAVPAAGAMLITGAPATLDPAPLTPDNLAYLIYTSGSTGRPKGVAVTHRNIVASTAARWTYPALQQPARYLVMAPLTFDAAGGGLYCTLTQGGTVVIPTDEETHDPRALARLMSSAEITHFDGVPSQYAVLLETGTPATASLRCCVLAGEALRPSLVRAHYEHSPEATLVNEYGPTEATIWATTHVTSPADGHARTVPIGTPIPNTTTYILDTHLNPVPPGTPGELFIGGPAITRGYHHQPALTAQRYLPDPYATTPGARLYRTGDRARQHPDGTIDYLGRTDHQIKIRGFRVELPEIENTLLQHPAITQAIVTPHPTPQGTTRLTAHIVTHGGQTVTRQELSRHLLGSLPDYMVPSAFVVLDTMPMTAHGKIDRDALPAPQTVPDSEGYVEPSTPLERTVARCFGEVLGIDPVSADTDFFKAGGDSLVVARLIARLARVCDVTPPVDEFFRVPTVRGVAASIEMHRALNRGDLDPGALYAMEVAELRDEIKIDDSIRVDGLPVADYLHPRHVLITGATGYIGAFMLEQLVRKTDAVVHCLVRGESQAAAAEKLEGALAGFGIWTEELRPRLRVVAGDLGQPGLGLADDVLDELAGTIDAIYHSGALVNFTFPYEALRAANVSGTHELIKLACRGKVKGFHHISTMDVFVGTHAERPWLEQDPGDRPALLPTGYPRSKWIAEKMVALARDRGLPACIYRPWVVIGHSTAGTAHRTDYMFVALKGYLELGFLPRVTEVLNAVTVDYFAEAAVHLSLREDSFGKYFNIGNLEAVEYPQLYAWVESFGYHPRVIDRDRARELSLQVGQESPLYPITPIIRSGRRDHPWLEPENHRKIDPASECSNVLAGLRGSGIQCPPVTEQLVHTVLQYMVDTGHLPAPESVSTARAAVAAG